MVQYKNTRLIKKTKYFKFILLFLVIFLVIINSCSDIHKSIYGEKELTIINETDYSITVKIYTLTKSKSKKLGSVSSNSEKTFDIDLSNDCHYDLEAYSISGGINKSQNNMDLCGGASWTIY